jgi:hypothetical protein
MTPFSGLAGAFRPRCGPVRLPWENFIDHAPLPIHIFAMPDSLDDDRLLPHEHLVNHTVVSEADAVRMLNPGKFLYAMREGLVGEFHDRGDNPRHFMGRKAA